LTDQDVNDFVEKIATKTAKIFRKKEYLQDEGAEVLHSERDQLFQYYPV